MADNSVVKLRIDSREYDANIKKAGEALTRYFQTVRQGGGTLKYLDEGVMEAVQGMRSMETKATSAKGKIAEMRKAFVDLNVAYQNFTEEEKQLPIGKEMSKSLESLKKQIKETYSQMSAAESELTDWRSILDSVGSKLGISGDLMGVIASGTMGMTAAITASVTAVIAAARAWDDYNSELSKQSQIVGVTTGLSGEAGGRLGDAGRAIAQTYGVDFREVINAANTLMTQFGETSDNAIRLLRDGMRGMIMGDGGKLLQMIKQFAPAFQTAGVSASQLIAIIQNSEGGLFTDENMSAIIYGLASVREMSKGTAEALKGVGINGDEMKRKLADGSMTVFEALQQVSKAIDSNRDNVEVSGAAMQAVFKRASRTAGDNLSKAIAELNTNLEETKTQTGELGKSLSRLELANEKMSESMREAIGMESWEELKTFLEADMTVALAEVIKGFRVVIDDFVQLGEAIGDAGKWLKDTFGIFPALILPGALAIQGISDAFEDMGKSGKSAIETVGEALLWVMSPLTTVIQGLRTIAAFRGNEDSATSAVGGALTDMLQGYTPGKSGGILGSAAAAMRQLRERFGNNGGSGGGNNNPPKTTHSGGGTTRVLTEEESNNARIRELTDEYIKASEKRREAIRAEIADLQAQNEEIKKLRDEAQGIGAWKPTEVKDLGLIGNLKDRLATVENSYSQAADVEELRTMQAEAKSLRDQIQELERPVEIKVHMDTSATLGIVQQLELEIQNVQAAMKGALSKEDYDDMAAYLEKLKEELKDFQSTDKAKEKANATADAYTKAAQAVSSLGSAMQGIEDPAAKVMGIIAQAIATIALTFAESLRKTFTPWDWIAAAAAGTATMVSTIAAIKSATASAGNYAQGGIIQGTSYSGDNLRLPYGDAIGVNAGEVVLTKAQTGNLADALQGGGMQGMTLSTKIDGEDLLIVLNRNNQRRGRGKIAYTHG